MKKPQYQNLIDLWNEITCYGNWDGDYYDKMFHDVPDTECVDRIVFILHKCMDKTVLDIGCLGKLHEQIVEVAKEVWGIDKEESDLKNYWKVDIEKDPNFLKFASDKEFDIIICGEILEHLSNPGIFLEKLKNCNCPIIITVPNAFAKSSEGWLQKRKECVNSEHVSWYSYYTLKNLIERYGYNVKEFYWAGEPHFFSEGIIMVIKQGGTKNGNA